MFKNINMEYANTPSVLVFKRSAPETRMQNNLGFILILQIKRFKLSKF